MKVILIKEYESLGSVGDIVTVKDGFFRNFLLPKKIAILLTKGSQKDLDQRIQRIREKAAQKHQADLEKAEKIKGLGILTLEAHSGKTGRLYGTITTKELAGMLSQQLGFEIDRRTLNVDRPINQVGDYALSIKLSPKVTAAVKLEIHSSAVQADEQPETPDEIANDVLDFDLEEAFRD
ncbi:MAG: 50S ribosomal protein L9 [Cyanobacteria bacterium P01_H01_bin.74]